LRIPQLRKRAKMMRWVVAVALLCGAVAAWYVYWTKSQPVGPSYRTYAVQRRTIVRTVEATGRLDTRLRFEVSPPAPGRLATIEAKVGDRVKQGALLARLDDRAAALTVQTAAATREAVSWRAAEAKTALETAKRERTQVERLVAKGLASTRELSAAQEQEARAQSALRAALAERGVAESNVATAKLTEKFGAIVAPIDGIVLVAPETPGVVVTPERGALFVIGESLEKLRLTVNVSEADVGDVRPEQQARFEVQAFPGRSFDARVERVGLDARFEGGVVTYPVQLLAANPEGVLLPGMSAIVNIEVARVKDVLAVREAALRFEPEGAPDAKSRSRVFRLRGANLAAVNVQSGLSDGMYTEVRPAAEETLTEGDRVVVGTSYTATGSSKQPGLTLGNKDKK
jgi:HlyD family secretion protein